MVILESFCWVVVIDTVQSKDKGVDRVKVRIVSRWALGKTMAAKHLLTSV